MTENKLDKTFDDSLFGNKVIIGNPKNKDKTEPVIDLGIFEDEDVLTIRSEKVFDSSKLEVDELLFENQGEKFYCKKHDENTLKFGVILTEKPAGNVFALKIDGWENFNFFFQPPLANTDPDGSTWEPNGWGGTSRRSADVNGSYAVYHKTKRDHIIGQKNYATGKAFHIYRPRFIDANGAMAWADLHIEKGDYTVTVLQSFLDSAVYPVKANDTLGYTTIGSTTDNGNLDIFIGFGGAATTMPATGGTATAIAAAVYHATPAGNIKMCLYSDIGTNLPIARLDTGTGAIAVTRTTAPTNSGEFLSGSISTALSASTKYWLCINHDNNDIQWKFDSGTGNRVGGASGSTYASFPPLTAPVISNNDRSHSFFVTYTPTAANIRSMMLMGVG